MQVLANAGIMALASMFVPILPLAMAIVYAIWPTEQRLTLVRVMSLAAVFASLSGTALGLINQLVFIGRTQPTSFPPVVAVGTAESLVPLLFGFGSLTVTWLCVAIGMWRRP